eukprot:scaffold19472_cov60-Phaeocystis_antarctica.AAC.1
MPCTRDCRCRYRPRCPSRCNWIGCNPHLASSTLARRPRAATLSSRTIHRRRTLSSHYCNSAAAAATATAMEAAREVAMGEVAMGHAALRCASLHAPAGLLGAV